MDQLKAAVAAAKIPFAAGVRFIAAHPKTTLALWLVSLALTIRYF